MVNYSFYSKNDLINICKSRNYKNIFNKKKEDLIKLIKKGGYNHNNGNKLETFEKLLLITFGIDLDKIKYKQIYLDYKDLEYLRLIKFLINSEHYVDTDTIDKINNISDKKVIIFLFLLLETLKFNINNDKRSFGDLISEMFKENILANLEFSDEFLKDKKINQINELKKKILEKVGNLSTKQVTFMKDIYDSSRSYKKIKKLNDIKLIQNNNKNFVNLKKKKEEELKKKLRSYENTVSKYTKGIFFNCNFLLFTPINISIYNDSLEHFIQFINNNIKREVLNFIPNTDDVQLNSLGFAIFTGKVKYIKLLLDNGVDFRKVTKDNEDALTFALQMYYVIIKNNYGKNNNNKNNNNNKIIEFTVCTEQEILQIIEILIPYYQEKSNVSLLGHRGIKKYITKGNPKFIISEILKKLNNGLFKNEFENKIEKTKEQIRKINKLIEKQKEELKNAFYLSRKPIFNKFRKKQKFEEEEPLINGIQTSLNNQIGGSKTSTFTFIQFILLISGGLSFVFACGASTGGICFLVLIIAYLVFVTTGTIVYTSKSLKTKINDNIDNYFKDNIVEKDVLGEFLQLSNNINTINFKKYHNTKIELFSISPKNEIGLQVVISQIAMVIIEKNKIYKYLSNINNEKFQYLNVFNKGNNKGIYGIDNTKRFFKDKDINIDNFNYYKLLFHENNQNNEKIMNKFKGFTVDTDTKYKINKNNRYTVNYRNFDFYMNQFIVMKDNPNMSLLEFYLFSKYKKFTYHYCNYALKLKETMDNFLNNRKNNTNKLRSFTYTDKYENLLKTEIGKSIEKFFNDLNKTENVSSKNVTKNLINHINKNCKIGYSNNTYNDIKNFDFISKADSNQNYKDSTIVLFVALCKKKKLMMEEFIEYFIENEIKDGNIKKEYELYLTKFNVKRNTGYTKDYILKKYVDLHERSGLYQIWMNTLCAYSANRENMNDLEFIIRFASNNFENFKPKIKYHNDQNIYYKNSDFYLLTENFREQFPKDGGPIHFQNLKNIVVYQDKKDILNKYEIKFYDYICRHVEENLLNNNGELLAINPPKIPKKAEKPQLKFSNKSNIEKYELSKNEIKYKKLLSNQFPVLPENMTKNDFLNLSKEQFKELYSKEINFNKINFFLPGKKVNNDGKRYAQFFSENYMNQMKQKKYSGNLTFNKLDNNDFMIIKKTMWSILSIKPSAVKPQLDSSHKKTYNTGNSAIKSRKKFFDFINNQKKKRENISQKFQEKQEIKLMGNENTRSIKRNEERREQEETQKMSKGNQESKNYRTKEKFNKQYESLTNLTNSNIIRNSNNE